MPECARAQTSSQPAHTLARPHVCRQSGLRAGVGVGVVGVAAFGFALDFRSTQSKAVTAPPDAQCKSQCSLFQADRQGDAGLPGRLGF